MKIVVTAGGTGGHIFPALAIINKLKTKYKDLEILYIGTTNRMESKLIPSKNINYIGIEIKGLDRSHLLNNFNTLKYFRKAIKKCKNVLKDFKPDLVIGVGGYVTLPVLYAAHRLNIKTVIHEQNSIPGLSNKLIANFADKIFVSLPGSEKYFNKNKTVYTGNPRSEEIYLAHKTKKKEFGLSEDKKLVIIVMGSLGSQTINKKMKHILKCFKDKSYEVLFITGDSYYEEFKKEKLPSNVYIKPLISDWLGIMKNCDLIVSRAGATTISEITSVGVPAILVPSPYVTNNHQYKNAMQLYENKACFIIEEKELTKDKLINEIDRIINNKEISDSLKNNAKKMGKVNSTTLICNEIDKLIR